MKKTMASVFFDILYYTIGNIIVCIFENSELNLLIITAGVYKLRLAEAKFPSCYLCLTYSHIRTALKGLRLMWPSVVRFMCMSLEMS